MNSLSQIRGARASVVFVWFGLLLVFLVVFGLFLCVFVVDSPGWASFPRFSCVLFLWHWVACMLLCSLVLLPHVVGSLLLSSPMQCDCTLDSLQLCKGKLAVGGVWSRCENRWCGMAKWCGSRDVRQRQRTSVSTV